MSFLITLLLPLVLVILPGPTHTIYGSEDDAITAYFVMGYAYEVIVAFLAKFQGISLSLRTLKRRLARLDLRRRSILLNMEDVRTAITCEIAGPGQLLGYRQMTQVLRQKYNLQVPRETVRLIIRSIDPDGVMSRRTRRLVRRVYSSPGPSFCWHIDGYDKLKPFGFAISGCIDGYSRRILWLEVGSTNNDPNVIASYYLDCVQFFGGCPLRIRTDCGTENGTMAALHTMFWQNADELRGSHSYGTSQANQRIECWWSYLKKSSSAWWIELFQDLSESGAFLRGNERLTDCLRFCFMEVIQQELDDVVRRWNSHRIRTSHYARCPAGVPDELFFLPERFSTHDYMLAVNEQDLLACEGWVTKKSVCSNAVYYEYLQHICDQYNFGKPQSYIEATKLYFDLVNLIT